MLLNAFIPKTICFYLSVFFFFSSLNISLHQGFYTSVNNMLSTLVVQDIYLMIQDIFVLGQIVSAKISF